MAQVQTPGTHDSGQAPREARLRGHETRQPFDLSARLQEKVDTLDLGAAVEQVKDEGYSYVRDAAPPEFTTRLRETLLGITNGLPGASMLLGKDPIFEEVVLNPKLLAMAEVMCGKGFMLSQLACSVRGKGAPAMDLHADQNWTPAPFPVHNQLVTFCWACDEHTLEGGATRIIPGSQQHRRHPSSEEMAEAKGAITTECSAGSVPFWDGSVWHGNWARQLEGERVVLHITYSRLALRPVESYDHLGEDWLEGKPYEMRVLLGREDFLNTSQGGFAHADKMARTMRWSKS